MSEHADIGILALQGGVIEHRSHLAALDIACRDVRYPHDLEGLAGLIIPGGESTCLARLLRITGLHDAILDAVRKKGLRLWGTCAGAILLATEVVGQKAYLGLVDMAVRRNAFGSQLASFQTTAAVPAVSADPVPLVFIRAPQIVRVGTGVTVLVEMNGFVAAAQVDDRILVTVFHPELSESLAFHRHFGRMCGLGIAQDSRTVSRPFLGWTLERPAGAPTPREVQS